MTNNEIAKGKTNCAETILHTRTSTDHVYEHECSMLPYVRTCNSACMYAYTFVCAWVDVWVFVSAYMYAWIWRIVRSIKWITGVPSCFIMII